MADKACETCRWWSGQVNGYADGLGECRLALPIIVAWGGTDINYRAWPRVFKSDWCGKHQPKGAKSG